MSFDDETTAVLKLFPSRIRVRTGGFRFYLYCTVLYVCLKYKSSAVWRYCRQSLVCATIQSQTRSDPSMLKKENGLVECGSAGTSNRRGVCACATTSLLTCSQINQVIIKWIFLPFLFNGSQIIHTKINSKTNTHAFAIYRLVSSTLFYKEVKIDDAMMARFLNCHQTGRRFRDWHWFIFRRFDVMWI